MRGAAETDIGEGEEAVECDRTIEVRPARGAVEGCDAESSAGGDEGEVESGWKASSTIIGEAGLGAPSLGLVWLAAAHAIGTAAAASSGGGDVDVQALAGLAGRACSDRTSKSTKEGLALSRGRKPSCMQTEFGKSNGSFAAFCCAAAS